MTVQSLALNDELDIIAQADEDNKTDQFAFEDLYNKHYRRVYSLCLRMTANVADAEDLAQDVFIQVQRKLASFRGDSAFTTWLHRIAVNQVLMHFRKRSVRSEMTTETGEMPEHVTAIEKKQAAVPVIDRIALVAAVDKLPNGYRTVFLLHDVEGYEHEEIAKVLGISAGTSKSQLHKARMRLRSMLRKRVDRLYEPKSSEGDFENDVL
jgi:RNA polymerase sigma-70 factor, ECF subfamily